MFSLPSLTKSKQKQRSALDSIAPLGSQPQRKRQGTPFKQPLKKSSVNHQDTQQPPPHDRKALLLAQHRKQRGSSHTQHPLSVHKRSQSPFDNNSNKLHHINNNNQSNSNYIPSNEADERIKRWKQKIAAAKQSLLINGSDSAQSPFLYAEHKRSQVNNIPTTSSVNHQVLENNNNNNYRGTVSNHSSRTTTRTRPNSRLNQENRSDLADSDKPRANSANEKLAYLESQRKILLQAAVANEKPSHLHIKTREYTPTRSATAERAQNPFEFASS